MSDGESKTRQRTIVPAFESPRKKSRLSSVAGEQ
jgi:hypothetical protein